MGVEITVKFLNGLSSNFICTWLWDFTRSLPNSPSHFLCRRPCPRPSPPGSPWSGRHFPPSLPLLYHLVPLFSFLFNFRYQVLKHNKLVGILNCLKRTERGWIWRGGGGRFQAIIWIHNSCIRPTPNQNYINYKSIYNPPPPFLWFESFVK